MIYLPVTPDSLQQAADIIKDGGLVAFPTETVYGLGADAFNSTALAKIFDAKNRPYFDPLIIHIAAIESLEKVADISLIDEKTRKKLFLLAENLWPGPLSIVLPKNKKIPGIATAGLETAAIRFPDHDAAQKLISLSSGAVAAPSANPFGSLSPTKAEHVRDKLGNKVDMILDGGSTRIGLESTVLDISSDSIKILRPGGTSKEVIEELVGSIDNGELRIKNEKHVKSAVHSPKASPGMLKSHYAPKTPLYTLNREEIFCQPAKTGDVFLFFDDSTRDLWQKKQNLPEAGTIRVLSDTGNMLEAASRLFEILHELDNGDYLRIYAQLVPKEGLGEAINDRLIRASRRE